MPFIVRKADTWGNILKSDTKVIAADNPFGYAGYMYDKEIGMYYLIARYYTPDHGVFLSGVEPASPSETAVFEYSEYKSLINDAGSPFK
nr:RHS repeat-associated core domain-containing protein [Bacillus cereus]